MGIEELLADAGVEGEDDLTAPVDETPPATQTDGADTPPVSEEAEKVEPPPADEPPPAAPAQPDPNEQQLIEMRQMLREARKEITSLRAAMQRVGTKPTVNDDGEEVPPEPSRIEQLQDAIAAVGQSKSAVLEVLVETMEMTPKYQDVRSVCTKANFDDIFEAAASKIARESGKSFDEALLEVELSVWKMPNPYKYMYDVIKKFHPRFATKTAAPAPASTGKQPKPVVAPSSVSAMGGDSDVKSGWTAARIDAMDVSELDSVPPEIYEKYLLGTLK